MASPPLGQMRDALVRYRFCLTVSDERAPVRADFDEQLAQFTDNAALDHAGRSP